MVVLKHATTGDGAKLVLLREPSGLALDVNPAGLPFVTYTDVSSGMPKVYARASQEAAGRIFYVNDAFVQGDVFTQAAGRSSNDGLTAATPKDSIQSVLDAYALQSGDYIFVDHGDYRKDVLVGANDSDFSVVGAPGFGSVAHGKIGLQAALGVTFRGLEVTAGVEVLSGQDVSFVGNVLARNGLLITDGSGLSFFGNRIERASVGIDLSGTPQDVSLYDNEIAARTAGVRVRGAVTGLDARANEIHARGTGIEIVSSAEGDFSENRVSADQRLGTCNPPLPVAFITTSFSAPRPVCSIGLPRDFRKT